jgi:hypothetical protein
MKKVITIGSDPEIFVASPNGALVSAEGLIKATKENPLPFGGEGFFVQEDNVMVEFNTPPATSAEEFSVNHLTILSLIQNEYLDPNNLEFKYESSGHFNPNDLLTEQASTFGCEPDYTIYPKITKNKAPDGNSTTLRTCGGHLHYGYMPKNNSDFIKRMRLLDLMVGLPLAFEDRGSERTTMYGKAGCFRQKPYGFEYRTPSNVWLRSKELMEFAFEKSREALTTNIKVDTSLSQRVVEALNTGNAEMAYEIITENKLETVN